MGAKAYIQGSKAVLAAAGRRRAEARITIIVDLEDVASAALVQAAREELDAQYDEVATTLSGLHREAQARGAHVEVEVQGAASPEQVQQVVDAMEQQRRRLGLGESGV